jgi:hypothetical protein
MTIDKDGLAPCGGCGNDDPAKRCIGCMHQFHTAIPNTGDELVGRLNSAASIMEQWDAWEIGAANKPTIRLTVSPSKLLREAATAIRALKEVR